MPSLLAVARRGWPLVIRLLTPPRLIRPTREGTWFILTTLGLGVAATNTGNNLLYLVLAMMLSVIIISGVLSEQSLKRVRATAEPPAACFAGQPVTVRVRVANHRRRTPALSVCVRSGGMRGPVIGYCPKLRPAESGWLSMRVTFPRRGWQTLEPLRLTTRFPFGLFEKATRAVPGPRVLVYPALRPVPLAAIAGLGGMGLLDDALKLARPNAGGLRKSPKLMTALVIGAGIGWLTADPRLGYRELSLPWIAHRIDVGALWIPLAMAVVAGSAHAVNLTDGMDGLASGCLAIAFAALAVVGVRHADAPTGSAVLPVWSASLAGACIGFLWFNSHPASVFLGDVGALGLGAALGAIALLSHQALGLLLIGGVFVAEACSVMLQVASFKLRNGHRIFRVAPLHHHVHLGGVAEERVVMRFWIVSVVLAALGISAFA